MFLLFFFYSTYTNTQILLVLHGLVLHLQFSLAARQTQMQFRNSELHLFSFLSLCFWFSLFFSRFLCFFFQFGEFFLCIYLYSHRSYEGGKFVDLFGICMGNNFYANSSYSWARHGLFALLFSHAITVKLILKGEKETEL